MKIILDFDADGFDRKCGACVPLRTGPHAELRGMTTTCGKATPEELREFVSSTILSESLSDGLDPVCGFVKLESIVADAPSSATGRTASDPPMHNIPIRTELGRQLRSAFKDAMARERRAIFFRRAGVSSSQEPDPNLPSVYKMTNTGGPEFTARDGYGAGEWLIEGPGLEPKYLYFVDRAAAEIVVRALNQAYAIGHAYGRGAGK